MTPFGFNSVANIFGAQPQQPSMFGGLGNFSNALTGLGLGIAQSDPNMPWARRATQGLAGFSAGRQLDKKAKKEREREEALKGALANAKDLGIPPTLAPYFQAYPEQFGSVLANSLKSKEPDLPTSYQEYMLGKNDPDYAKTLQSQDGLPTSVEEYQFAVSQGFSGTFQDWEMAKKGGMALQVDPATGAVTFQQGANIKPLTEGQSKDTVFATRAAGALPIIDQYGEALTNFGEYAAGGLGVPGNYLQSPEYQQAKQAGQEFLQAILRKDTGAAITPQETAEYGSVYLPQPGNGPPVLEQKRQSRHRALEALKAGMPPQAILAQERALQNAAQRDPTTSGGGWQDLGGGVRIRELP